MTPFTGFVTPSHHRTGPRIVDLTKVTVRPVAKETVVLAATATSTLTTALRVVGSSYRHLLLLADATASSAAAAATSIRATVVEHGGRRYMPR